MGKATIRIALCAAVLAATASCGDGIKALTGGQTEQDVKDSTPKGMFRKYAYVVEVDTPQGIMSGRSVNGVRYDCHRSLNGSMCNSTEISEAAAVDLPDGRTLYALLTQHSEPEYVCCLHPRAMKEGATQAISEFLPDQYPDLTMFGDPRDPKSIRVVDGTKPFDRGYRIKRIYLAATNDQMTHDIPRRLPWLPGFDGRFCECGMGADDGPDPERFGKSDFMEGYNAK